MNRNVIATARQSVIVWPVSEVFVMGVATILLTMNRILSLGEGLFLFGSTTIAILLINVYGELVQVHLLVNYQHDDLLRQNQQLMTQIQTLLEELQHPQETSP